MSRACASPRAFPQRVGVDLGVMAQDRFIHFKKAGPSHDDVQKILENYFGGCGSVEESQANWWIIRLPGKPTSPFEGVDGNGAFPRMGHDTPERWIEVVFSPGKLDVLTRVQDEFTNGIADQLARAFARYYRAKLED